MPLRSFRLQRGADRFGPKKMVVVEIDQDATRLVTLSRNGTSMRWESAKSLPRVDQDLLIGNEPLANFLKKEEQQNTRYASVLLNAHTAVVRLLNFSGQPGRSTAVAREVQQTLGVDDAYEVRHRVIRRSESGGDENAEYAVLAAAIPGEDSEKLRTAVESAGMTPVSLMPHGVAVANLAETSVVDLMTNDKALGFLRVGATSSMLILYVSENLTLARQFKTGFNALLETVIKDYGLDEETAAKFVSSGSFDFTGNLSAAAKSWIHQIGISLDFIERRHGQRVDELHILGSDNGVAALRAAFQGSVDRNIKVWNAIDRLAVEGKPSSLQGSGQEYAIAVCEAQRVMQEGLKAHA